MAAESLASLLEKKARNFDECRQAALDWLEKNPSKEWELLYADETDRNLVLQHRTRSISFTISVSSSSSGQPRFKARCDSDSDLKRRLHEACKMDTIEGCLESSISAVEQEEYVDGSDDNDSDGDMDVDYYENGEMDLELEDQGTEGSGPKARKTDSSEEIPEAVFQKYSKSGSQLAVHRLLSDFKKFQESNGVYGFRGSPREDNLFLWDVQLIDFEEKSPLYKDLVKYAERYNRKREIEIEMAFPNDYPMSPPFIRVIRPRFKFLTGHVTIGGSICMQLLTKSGWTAAHDIESTLVQVRSAITSDPNASLDLTDAAREYSLSEAQKAFNRMVHNHGWSN